MIDSLSENHECINGTEEQRFAFALPVSNQEDSGRKLLQTRTSSYSAGTVLGLPAASDDAENIWGAYKLTVQELSAFGPNAEAMSMETMLRGATNSRNFIVGGIVIQTERSTKRHVCYGRFARLIEYCYSVPVHEVDRSTTPYGRDPVFLTDSVLFNEDAAMRTAKYYDTDKPSETSASGIPYAFQPSEERVKMGTHYVYVDTQFDRATVTKLLQYLTEGRFLDASTDSVVVRFITYNPQSLPTILAVNEVRCTWGQSIECRHMIDALPDIQWSQSPTAAATAVVALLVAMYWTVILYEITTGTKTGEILWNRWLCSTLL